MRFSVRALFLLTTVAALYAWFAATFPGPTIVITVLVILPPIVGFAMTWAAVGVVWFLVSVLRRAVEISRQR